MSLLLDAQAARHAGGFDVALPWSVTRSDDDYGDDSTPAAPPARVLPPLPPGAPHAFRVRARYADSGAWGPWSKPSPPFPVWVKFAAAPPLPVSAGR